MNDIYATTASGRSINLTNPTVGMIDIEDIATHLSKICRFGGALPGDGIYSVAQHSVWVARQVEVVCKDWNVIKYALLHDAAEAYLGDVITPLKRRLLVDADLDLHDLPRPIFWAYTDVEARMLRVIGEALGLPICSVNERSLVKWMDSQALATEERDLRGIVVNTAPAYKGQWYMPEPASKKIVPISPAAAKRSFLAFWEGLNN